MAYRPRLQSSDIAITREPWFAAGFPSPAVTVYPPPEVGDARPSPLEYVLEHVFRHILCQLHIRPLGALRSVIEDKLGSKIFVRNSDYLSGRFRAISKYCLMQPFLNREAKGPLAFYATVVRPPSISETCDTRFLQYRLTVGHEFLHHYLHIAPELERIRGNQRALDALNDQYLVFLADGNLPLFGPKPEIAELEADLCAFFLLLAHGYLVMAPRTKSAISELYRREPVDPDVVANWIDRYSQLVPRPQSLNQFQLSQPIQGTGAVHQKNENALLDSPGLFQKVIQCIDSFRPGIARPYAWACTSIEHLFRGEGHAWRNVSIKLVGGEYKEPFCAIERIDLDTVLEQRSELRRHWHLLKYSIHYPIHWKIQENTGQRLSLLQWIGLIDLSERRNPPKGPIRREKRLSDYSCDDLEFARLYAIAMDALSGEPGLYQAFDRSLAESMLAGSTVSIEQFAGDPWRGLLSSFLRSEQDLSTIDTKSMPMEVNISAEEATQRMEVDEDWYWNHREELLCKYGRRGYIAVLEKKVIEFDSDLHSLMRKMELKNGAMSFYLGDLELQLRQDNESVLVGIREDGVA